MTSSLQTYFDQLRNEKGLCSSSNKNEPTRFLLVQDNAKSRQEIFNSIRKNGHRKKNRSNQHPSLVSPSGLRHSAAPNLPLRKSSVDKLVSLCAARPPSLPLRKRSTDKLLESHNEKYDLNCMQGGRNKADLFFQVAPSFLPRPKRTSLSSQKRFDYFMDEIEKLLVDSPPF